MDAGSRSVKAFDLAYRVTHNYGANQFDLVMGLTSYLQQNFQHTQQLGHVPAGKDPVAWFLFDAKKGYCEQFAAAETRMQRGLSIPRRRAPCYPTGDASPRLAQ